VATPALAGEWRKVTGNASAGFVIGIDAASISGPDNARTANITFIYKEAKVYPTATVEYTVERREIDCGRKTTALRHLTLNSASGGVIEEADMTNPGTPIATNTIAENIANAICKRQWQSSPAALGNLADFFRAQRAAQLGK